MFDGRHIDLCTFFLKACCTFHPLQGNLNHVIKSLLHALKIMFFLITILTFLVELLKGTLSHSGNTDAQSKLFIFVFLSCLLPNDILS